MENGKEYLSTFRFYNNKGERVSAFATPAEGKGNLIITIIPCSKKDAFSKKQGRKMYEEKTYLKRYTEVNRQYPENGQTKKDFLNYMRENFYRPVIIDVQVELLVRGDKNAEILDVLTYTDY